MSAAGSESIAAIARFLADRTEDVVRHLYPNGKKQGNYWIVGDCRGSDATHHGSYRVYLTGEKAGLCCDYATGDPAHDLVDAWMYARGHATKAEALKEIKTHYGLNDADVPSQQPKPIAPKPTPRSRERMPANLEYLARRATRLAGNTEALGWLEGRGISLETATAFHLGLSEPYAAKHGHTQDALVAPLIARDGMVLKGAAYYCIPGVTMNPVDANGWCKGAPATYHGLAYHGQKGVFICEGLKDLWRVYEAIRGTELAEKIHLISSTHGAGIPDEWSQGAFWEDFDVIYCGHDRDGGKGDKIALKVVKAIGREARRVVIPDWVAGRTAANGKPAKDWTDYWNTNGSSVAEFKRLCEEAPAVAEDVQELEEDGYGRMGYKPVNIDGAYHGGYLYYVTETMVREQVEMAVPKGEGTRTVLIEEIETVVVRSDRTVHSSKVSKARPGKRPVIRLTDGTVIESMPRSNKYATWEWSSISAWLKGQTRVRPLAQILNDVKRHLAASVWLPYDEDYTLLALVVPITYLQAVFDAVPLILLNGLPSTGKTRVGAAMVDLCANAHLVGQISAASIARLVHESRGFVVLDDLESVGKRGRETADFSELVQALKVSYNQRSGVKLWTDTKTMRTERLNFFGVKLVNNTTGVDAILGSRMLRIQTRRMPEGVADAFLDRPGLTTYEVEALRQELHQWAFTHVADVERAYRRVYPGPTDRFDEITAPLKAFADIACDEEITTSLNTALRRQEQAPQILTEPSEALHEAIRNLVLDGYEWIAITHVSLEMARLMDDRFGQTLTNEVPEWLTPEWVGRQIRAGDYIDSTAKERRERLFGKQLKVLKLRDDYIQEMRDWAASQNLHVKDPQTAFAFCRKCEECEYRLAGCNIMARRVDAENKDKKRLLAQKH